MSKKGKRGSHEAESTKISAFEQRQREHVHYQPIGVRAQERQRRSAAKQGKLKPMRFVSLHHHSTFSFLDGFQLPEAHVRRATEINMGALAMTEHGNIFSHVKLETAAAEQGVKPIFGCEFYVGWTDEKRRSQKKNHITVLAKNKRGYQNLLRLVNMSWSKGFYYEPTVDWRWLVRHQKGLIILSGCSGSALFTAMVGGKHVKEEDASYARGLKVAKWLDGRFDDLFIEVQAFPELEKTCRANPMLARVASDIGRPLVATMDCHYTAPEEAEIQKILHSVRPGEQRTAEEMERDWGYDVPLCAPPTDKAILRRLERTGLTPEQAMEAVVSTEEIGQECSVTLPRLDTVEFPLPDGFDSAEQYWRKLLKDGWKYRGCDRLPAKERAEYKAQLEKEMELIEAKGFVNNILITADALQFMKKEQIPVGPARGSAAASLACYLLRITEVNPMDFPYLVFERFIDWSREDVPDIDIDIATYGRPILRRYLEEKYGPGCVNNIGTFTSYKAKNALGDIARVYQIEKRDVETIKELLIERSSGDLRASATLEDTVDQFDAAREAFNRHEELAYAMDLEGNLKAFGVHAAGLVISTEPLNRICSTINKEVPKGSGNWVDVITMDMKDAERQGMEKLDFLALSTMDMIAEAMYHLDMSVEDLYAIPFDDEETIQGFIDNDVAGIFQFDGRATRSVNGVVKAENIDEIALMVALSRPGPLHNGAVEGYANVKWGDAEDAERIHPALDPITEFTNYQIIYQEQILRIVKEIGDFDWEGAGEIRKIIAKKKGEQQFMAKWKAFRDGAKKTNDIDEETALRIWKMLTTSGAYAFNAAHSVSYGIIAYWSMWLKRKHPAAFFAASLAKFKNDEKLAALRRDTVKHGIEIRPPALDSDASWRPEGEDAIRAGWTQISGIGEKMAEKIAAYVEEHGDLKHWADLQNISGVGPKTVATVTEFVKAEDPFKIYKLEQAIQSVKADIPELGLPEPTHSCPEVIEENGGKPLVFLAQPVKRNLRDLYEANAKKGLAVDAKRIDRPDLHQWLILTTQDADEQVTCIFSRKTYPRFKDLLFNMKIGGDELVLVRGKKVKDTDGQKSGVAAVFVSNIWVLEDD